MSKRIPNHSHEDRLMERANISWLKSYIRNTLMHSAFKMEKEYQNEILIKFGGQFIYKGTFYNSNPAAASLTKLLADDYWAEFDPYHEEFEAMKRNYFQTQNHINNYLNQCKNEKDCMALLGKDLVHIVEDSYAVKMERSNLPRQPLTVTEDLVNQYRNDELFQQVIDRILILGDM